MNNYIIENDPEGFGKCLILKSKWTPENEKAIFKNKVSVLRLSFSNGWIDTDLSFIRNLKELKGVEVYNWQIRDLSPLLDLPQLIFLGIQAEIKKNFDLNSFPKLKTLKLFWNDKFKGLKESLNLEHINIVKFPYESFTSISGLKNLKRIQIVSRKFKSIEGLGAFSVLDDLDFYDCQKLDSLRGIGLAKELRSVRIASCTKLNDISPLGRLEKLETLIIENCGTIDSIGELQYCRKLKRLILIGSTSIKDGNLSVLKDLQNLKDISIASKRHYNLTKEQLDQLIANR